MLLIEKIGKNRVYLHLLYWVGTVLFFGAFWGTDTGDFVKTYYTELITLAPKIAVTYFVLYFSIPKFLFRNQYMMFALFIILPLVVGSVILFVIKLYLVYPYYPPDVIWKWDFNPYNLMSDAVDINTLMVLPVMAKIFKYYYKNKQAAETLAKEKLEAELKFLKSQIHPHFLFNTLNSLYSLTIKKSDAAPEVVLKLSALMRYLLHETNEKFVPLKKEIDYIKNYIDLEKLRYQNRVEISFNVYGNINGSMIAPMLILPFVENAFKHAVNKEIEQTWITIELTMLEDNMTLKVENSLPEEDEVITEIDMAKGIGLRNVKRRLELLYRDKYELKISKDDLSYSALLKLNLNENEKN